MSIRIIDELSNNQNRVPWSDWVEFNEKYSQQLGFSNPVWENMTSPFQHPIAAPSPNWLHFLPEDSVRRLRSAENLYTVVSGIVNDTHNRASSLAKEIEWDQVTPKQYVDANRCFSDTAPTDKKTIEKAIICAKIVAQFRGQVNFEKISRGLNPQSSPSTEPPKEISVVVVAQNDRNLEDFEIYTVNDVVNFFGTAYGDSTQMFEKLQQSSIQPDDTVENVAFDTELGPWFQLTPPGSAISFMTTDQKNRISFSRVQQPKELFGSSWGNVSEMVNILNQTDEADHLCSVGRSWRIDAGIRY